MRRTRPVSWIGAAHKAFQGFPVDARRKAWMALTILADGGMPDVVKPVAGFEPGTVEIALRHAGDAFRIVVALRLGIDLWVLHAFQKKSHRGIRTPRHEMDVVRGRIRQVRAMLQ